LFRVFLVAAFIPQPESDLPVQLIALFLYVLKVHEASEVLGNVSQSLEVSERRVGLDASVKLMHAVLGVERSTLTVADDVVLLDELVDEIVHDGPAFTQKLAIDELLAAEYQLSELATVRDLPQRGHLQGAGKLCIKLELSKMQAISRVIQLAGIA
jgi:hypothetical protein